MNTTLPMTCKVFANALPWRHQLNTPNDLQTVISSPALKTSTQHSQWLANCYLSPCPERLKTSAQHSQWPANCLLMPCPEDINITLPMTYKLLSYPLPWKHQHNTPNDLPTFSSSPEDIRWCVTCNTPTDLQTVSSSHALKTSDDVYQTTLPMTCKLLADLLSWRHQHNTPNDLQTISWSPVLKTSTQHSQWLVDC